MVFTKAYIQAGVMLSATLALQYVAGFAAATAGDFYAKAFAF